MRFEGTDTYVATPDLMLAVNAAITLERPLLVKGEPGTGKTMLAEEVARALGRPLLQWHIKSTTKAQQGLYEYDAVSRLRDSQLGDEHVADIAHYIKRGVLWEAFESRDAGGGADRRDRQGRHRVSERPAARARPHGVLRLRDAADGPGAAPAAGGHHLQQREGAARRVPAPLLLPLHQVPRQGDDEAHRRRAFPGTEEGAAQGGAGGLLRAARGAGAEEEAVDLGAARLAEAAARRGHPARGAAQHGQEGRSSRRCYGALLKNEQDVHLFERVVFMARSGR